MPLRQRIHRLFNSPKLSYWNAALCTGAICANLYYQVFCRPVPWAGIVLILAFIPVILYPRLRLGHLRWPRVFHFLFGIAACICLYCIIFLREMNLIALFSPFMAMPAGLLAYVPHFLLLQILYNLTRTLGSIPFRKFFFAGIALCAVYAIVMAVWFYRNYDAVYAAWTTPDHTTERIEPSYMTERMLGMHFKYHLSYTTYDGWRPPLHDPSIVVAVWLNSIVLPTLNHRGSPLLLNSGSYDLDMRIAQYNKVFPGLPVQQGCPCAYEYGDYYRNDELFKRAGSAIPRER